MAERQISGKQFWVWNNREFKITGEQISGV